MNVVTERALLSKSAAARVLGVCCQTVNRMIDAGELETRQPAGLSRPKVTRHSIDRYVTRSSPQMTKTVEQVLRDFHNR